MTLEAKTLFVALLVGLAHIISGIGALWAPSALNVVPLAALAWMPSDFAGAVLIGAGLMAVIGSRMNFALPKWAHSVLFLPQQTLLVLQVWTISTALIVGKYPDGYIPIGGPWFILTDQIWAWVLAVSHSVWLAAYIYGGVRGDSNTS